MREPRGPLPLPGKVALALRVWTTFAFVRSRLAEPLPELVEQLARTPASPLPAEHPRRVSRAVDRTLRIGRRRPTCLMSSLVLFRLLRRQGATVQLVIGLPPDAHGKDAHAWVELNGRVVGPPPGRLGHVPLARYP